MEERSYPSEGEVPSRPCVLYTESLNSVRRTTRSDNNRIESLFTTRLEPYDYEGLYTHSSSESINKSDSLDTFYAARSPQGLPTRQRPLPSFFKRCFQYILDNFSTVSLVVSVCVSIPVAFYKWHIASQDEISIATIQFQETAANVATALKAEINTSTFYTKMMANYFVAENNTLGRVRFRVATHTSFWANDFLQGIAFCPYVVGDEQRQFWENEGRANYSPNYTFTEMTPNGTLIPANRHPAYVPVQYEEPVEANRPAIGFDLYSEPSRRDAIDKAARTGRLTVTARLELVQVPSRTEYGILVFVPLFRVNNTVVPVVANQPQSLWALIAGVTRIDRVVYLGASSLTLPSKSVVLLFDTSSPTGQQYLGHYNPSNENPKFDNFTYLSTLSPDNLPADLLYTTPISFVDRDWSLVVIATPGFLDSQRTFVPTQVFLVSLIEPVLAIAFHFYLLARQRMRTTQPALPYQFLHEGAPGAVTISPAHPVLTSPPACAALDADPSSARSRQRTIMQKGNTKRVAPHRINLIAHQKERLDSLKDVYDTYADFIETLLDNLLSLYNTAPVRFSSGALQRLHSIGLAIGQKGASTTLTLKSSREQSEPAHQDGCSGDLRSSPSSDANSSTDLSTNAKSATTPSSPFWRIWIPASTMAKMIVLRGRCAPAEAKKLATWEFVEMMLDLFEMKNEGALQSGFLESAVDTTGFDSASMCSDGGSARATPSQSSSLPSDFSSPVEPVLALQAHPDTKWPAWLPGTNQFAVSDELVHDALRHFFKANDAAQKLVGCGVGTYVSMGLLYEPYLRASWGYQPEHLKFTLLTAGLWMKRQGSAPLSFIMPLFAKARELTMEAIETPTLELVQSLLLVGRQAFYMGDFKLLCRFIKMAIHAAQFLKIDRPSWYVGKTWLEAEHARRAWYQCVYLNYLVASHIMAYQSPESEPTHLTVHSPPTNEYLWTNLSDSMDLTTVPAAPFAVDPYIPTYAIDLLKFVQIQQQAIQYLSLFNNGLPEFNAETYELETARIEEYRLWQSLTLTTLSNWYASLPGWMTNLDNVLDDNKRNILGRLSLEIIHWNTMFYGTMMLVNYPAAIEELWRDEHSNSQTSIAIGTCLSTNEIFRHLVGMIYTLERDHCHDKSFLLNNFIPICRMINIISYRLNPAQPIEPLIMKWIRNDQYSHQPRPQFTEHPSKFFKDIFRKSMIRISPRVRSREIAREAVRRYRSLIYSVWDLAMGPWVPQDLWNQVAADLGLSQFIVQGCTVNIQELDPIFLSQFDVIRSKS
ncbi:chase domain-containing protein [Polychytrium aggregatum]|uniref:chase domain-containing protein n=1 Tax=Polychytrium aggregatum TaxID=110093 RepID=UPI0022FDDDE3|nr:chase domain-containing protein [Polychytrium aggregatum]KAI9209574.1 chase domain-containing protein [Polychytrium aggregatum]